MLEHGPGHGYELYSVLAAGGHDVGDRSLVYQELRVLERLYLVTSKIEVAGSGPARRVYTLADAGLERLHEARQSHP